MQAQPEQRNRAPGLEDALHGKAPVLETVSSLPQKGKLLRILYIQSTCSGTACCHAQPLRRVAAGQGA